MNPAGRPVATAPKFFPFGGTTRQRFAPFAIRISTICILITACASTTYAQSTTPELPRSLVPKPTTSAITAADLKSRTYSLADDSLEGREAGRRGGMKGEVMLANEFKRLGLEPAGDNGTFFQAIPLITRRADSASTLKTAQQSLTFGTDFLPMPKLGSQPFLGGLPYGKAFNATDVAVVYGGRIGESTMISPDAARGKFVVFSAPQNASGQVALNFWTRNNLLTYASAAGIGVTALDGGRSPLVTNPRETYYDKSNPFPGELAVVLLTSEGASKLFGAPINTLTPGASGQAVTAHVGFVETPLAFPARNVVGILRGTDAALSKQYVAVGAHHDHVGITQRPLDHDSVRAFNTIARIRGADDPPRPATPEQQPRIQALRDSLKAAHGTRVDSIQNGADDDASGTVIAMEIAEYFAQKSARPKRSLLFVLHTAEEKGLYGAQYFGDHPTVPRDSIVAQINMDQMGRGDPVDNPTGGPNSLVLIGSRRLSTQLGDLAETVNSRLAKPFKFDYNYDKDGDPTRAYCRSDHYMYARYGIPIVFFSAAAWHIDYHMVSDESQYIAYDRMNSIANYIRDFTREVANLAARPVVDKPKPDPNGTCVQ